MAQNKGINRWTRANIPPDANTNSDLTEACFLPRCHNVFLFQPSHVSRRHSRVHDCSSLGFSVSSHHACQVNSVRFPCLFPTATSPWSSRRFRNPRQIPKSPSYFVGSVGKFSTISHLSRRRRILPQTGWDQSISITKSTAILLRQMMKTCERLQ